MSLQVDESGRRGRSRSPGGRRRTDDEDDERDRSRGPPIPPKVVEATPGGGGGVPYPHDDPADSTAAYEYERLAKWRSASPSEEAFGGGSYRSSRDKVEAGDIMYGDIPDYRYEAPLPWEPKRNGSYERERPPPSPRADRPPASPMEDKFAFLPQKYAPQVTTVEPRDGPRDSRESSGRDRDLDRERRGKKEKKRDYDEDLAYGKEPGPKKEKDSSRCSYQGAKPHDYEKTDATSMQYSDPQYSSSSLDPRTRPDRGPSPGPGLERRESQRAGKRYSRESYLGTGDPRTSSSSVINVEPGAGPRRSAMKGGRERDASPQPAVAKMSSLSVNTGHHTLNMSLSAAPGSPLLESYHGTYQSMSPMPSPLMLPTHGAEIQIPTVSPIGSDDESSKRKSRRARFHDPVDDAARLAKALRGERRAPETEPLIEILPPLTHDQVMELRVKYKCLVKTGSERKGVNIAKHIRARLKDEDPSLMKACYATALGQWESEAYWANFWYQGDKTRRELLIEALMGRTNDEIRAIKAGFTDKKYSNSLTKCMKTELKEDKFKKAVLMVLDEQRMEELDGYGRPNRIDYDLVRDDVKELRRAVKSEKGGESAMIAIVVQRSGTHLRELMRAYSDNYRANFAKDALRKSGNLVGELLAHVLNGVINKPVRDALLVHHALSASRRDELRRELLVSRLVRYHWDARHMANVKIAFRDRYGTDMQEAVRDGTKGEWGQFCQALCVSRMPDDVKRFERAEHIR